MPEYTFEPDYIEAAAGTTPTVQFSVCPPLDEGVRHTLTKEGGGAATKRFKLEDGTIIFRRVTEADSGMYSISCENDVGVGQATLELSVLPSSNEPDKPTKSRQEDGPPSEWIVACTTDIIIIMWYVFLMKVVVM